MSAKEKALSNYIPISRKIFEHKFWLEERSFSKFEAWLDLLRTATYEPERKAIIKGKFIEWKRGQLPASLRYLSNRWGWSTKKVNFYLELLQKEKMAKKETQEETGQTIITICNYELYNIQSEKKKHLEKQQGNTEETVRKQQGNKIKNIKNIISKEKKVYKEKPTAEAATHTDEQKELFNQFDVWLQNKAPRIVQMKEPFTISQYFELRKKIPKEQLKDLLLKMHNWQPLLIKNHSAYLTVLSWAKKDDERNFKPSTQQTNGSVKTDIYKAREKETQTES